MVTALCPDSVEGIVTNFIGANRRIDKCSTLIEISPKSGEGKIAQCHIWKVDPNNIYMVNLDTKG